MGGGYGVELPARGGTSGGAGLAAMAAGRGWRRRALRLLTAGGGVLLTRFPFWHCFSGLLLCAERADGRRCGTEGGRGGCGTGPGVGPGLGWVEVQVWGWGSWLSVGRLGGILG